MKAKLLLLGGLGAVLFCGCNSAKLVHRHYDLYRTENREQFAGDCAAAFPVQPIYIPGKDSIYFQKEVVPGPSLPCPPADPVTGKPGFVQCPPCPPAEYHYRVDTFTRPDGAKQAALQLQADQLAKQAADDRQARGEAENDRDTWKAKSHLRFWIIIGLLIAAVAGFILKLKKVF